jgi:hypothetical protein
VTVNPVDAVVTEEKDGTSPSVELDDVVIAFEAAEGDEFPTEFVATTVNV